MSPHPHPARRPHKPARPLPASLGTPDAASDARGEAELLRARAVHERGAVATRRIEALGVVGD